MKYLAMELWIKRINSVVQQIANKYNFYMVVSY